MIIDVITEIITFDLLLDHHQSPYCWRNHCYHYHYFCCSNSYYDDHLFATVNTIAVIIAFIIIIIYHHYHHHQPSYAPHEYLHCSLELFFPFLDSSCPNILWKPASIKVVDCHHM